MNTLDMSNQVGQRGRGSLPLSPPTHSDTQQDHDRRRIGMCPQSTSKPTHSSKSDRTKLLQLRGGVGVATRSTFPHSPPTSYAWNWRSLAGAASILTRLNATIAMQTAGGVLGVWKCELKPAVDSRLPQVGARGGGILSPRSSAWSAPLCEIRMECQPDLQQKSPLSYI